MPSETVINIRDNDKEEFEGRTSDFVLDMLLEWIITGELQMGDKLNTKELASRLGVSRMPIREALKSLEKKGLVEYVPYAGAQLVKLTKEDIRQIYITRQALEPILAKTACEKICHSEIQTLEKIHEEYSETLMQPDLDAIKVYRLNRKYHFTIYKISGLERIFDVVESLWDTLSFFKLIYGQKLLDNKTARVEMIGEHESYLKALSQGDSEMMEFLMKRNLQKRIEEIPFKSDAYFGS